MTACNRRLLILGGTASVVAMAGSAAAAPTVTFAVSYSDAEWQRRLTPAQYDVLRRGKTERAGSSPLDREKRAGTFHCAGCGLALFASATKYDSGTGWPSFWHPLEGAVGTRPETFLFIRQTEVHCSRCGGHLGHVFGDGPPPTGLRYCMNGVAMTFRPTEASS
ncbi:MAG: peptide-methionine (R)-S-oxide reductase MsrB [Reyranella sp.]|nr:peptide-methionine (R)-S-oxide reductase MsrB [Reyranella sp.]